MRHRWLSYIFGKSLGVGGEDSRIMKFQNRSIDIFGIEWPARTYPCSHECFELNFRQIIAKTISLKVLVQITVYS